MNKTSDKNIYAKLHRCPYCPERWWVIGDNYFTFNAQAMTNKMDWLYHKADKHEREYLNEQ